MTMRFATGKDKIVFGLAVFFMIFYGSSRPMFSIMFGQTQRTVSNAEHGTEDSPKVWEAPVRMILVGIFAGTFRFLQIACLELFADSTVYKIKMEYFKAVMGKDS